MFGYRTFCNKVEQLRRHVLSIIALQIWNAVKYLRMNIGDFAFVPNATADVTGTRLLHIGHEADAGQARSPRWTSGC